LPTCPLNPPSPLPPPHSICSNNKQGAQAQESEKLTDEVIIDPIPSNECEAAAVEMPKTAPIEDIMLRPDVLLEKAEKLAPAAKKRRLAKESAKRLITNIVSPKTIPSLNIVEACRFLPEGYLEKLGGEGHASSLTPDSELTNQLNKCAEEIKNTHVTLSEEDTAQVKEINERIAKCKENLDSMIRKAYKVGGKGNKKRKSLEGELAAGREEEPAGAMPGEEDVKAGFEEILVAVRAKNLLLWG
jgi:hypothetical protein